MRWRHTPARQRGVVAIMVGLSIVAVIGAFGLAVDSGRLYVNKTELQNAADACALAAASQLSCAGGNCTSDFLAVAESAGRLAALRNRSQLQSTNVAVATSDITFSNSPSSGFLTRMGGASSNVTYARCVTRATGLVPYVLSALGSNAPIEVNAVATAGRQPSQRFCTEAPVGLCFKPSSTKPTFGYSVGEWVAAAYNNTPGTNGGSGGGNGNGNNNNNNNNGNNNADTDNATLDGSFSWITYSKQGAPSVQAQVSGNGVCNVAADEMVTRQPGVINSVRAAYNSRFGIYYKSGGANQAYTSQNAPPDRTGYAYPNSTFAQPTSANKNIANPTAYSDYLQRRNGFTPFNENSFVDGNKVKGTALSQSDHRLYGKDRRVVAIPVFDCSANKETKALAYSCMLMLNPMTTGNTGTLLLEYIGDANAANSPCLTSGLAGGPAGTGPQVVALVQ